MKKRILCIALALCMALSLLPMTALAVETHGEHAESWTALNTAGSGGAAFTGGTISTGGSYYLSDNLALTSTLTISGSDTVVTLCLNGNTLSCSADNTIKVETGATLNICDCDAGGAVSSAYYYGVYVNGGTVNISNGAVSSTSSYGVYVSSGTVNISGGTVSSAYYCGVYVNGGTVNISGGTVSSESRYGVYVSGGTLRLSGSPAISGDTDESDIYLGSGASLYANDGAASPAYYTGSDLVLEPYSYSSGSVAVYGVNDGNEGKFSLENTNYELVAGTETNLANLLIKGLEKTLTWQDEAGAALSGEGYPAAAEYGVSVSLPALPDKDGYTARGWVVSTDGGNTWSSAARTRTITIEANTSLKRLYTTGFAAGAGSAESPYEIATEAELQNLAALINNNVTGYNGAAVHYKLTAALDLSTVCGSETGSWTPIGNNSNPFSATFDGDGKTISGLYINAASSDYQGLFGYVSGTVKNLTLTGVDITGDEYVGGVAGYLTYAEAEPNPVYGAITGCTVRGSVSGNGYIGAGAGYVDSTWYPSHVSGTVSGCDFSGCSVSVPSGYTADAGNKMAYIQSGTTIDVMGCYNGSWIKTTYDNGGYVVSTDGLSGAAVTAETRFVSGGRYVQLRYTVTAGSTAITDGKLGVYADTQIGDNDAATIEVIQDAADNIIGLRMVDTHTNCPSKDAQYNLYFKDAGGVTPVNTYWFGAYYMQIGNCLNQLSATTEYEDEGTYSKDGDVYTAFSGDDSGLAFSWHNIALAAGESQTFSVVLGVGAASAPPRWYRVADENPVTLTKDGSSITVSAAVVTAADETHTLYYDIDGGESLTIGDFTVASPNDTISETVTLPSLAGGEHTLRFWAVNTSGASTEAVSHTITVDAPPPAPVIVGDSGTQVTVPVTSDAGSANVGASVTGGTASVTVTDEQLGAVIDDAEETGNVTVDVSGLANVQKATIPAEVVKATAESESATGLSVTLPTGSVTLDETAVKAVNSGDDITVSVEEVKPADLTQSQKETLGDAIENAVVVDVNVLVNGVKQHDFNGGRVTVSFPYTPAEGENVNKLTVWYIADDGTIENVGGYYDMASGSFVFTTTHLSQYVLVSGAEWQNPFTDVSESDWFYADVAFACANGLMDGVSATEFCPYMDTTRGMIVTVLWRMEGKPAATKAMTFTDVPEDKYYRAAVEWAAENGIVDGYSPLIFCPECPITREQLAAVLWRYAKYKGADVSVGEDTNILSYPDAADVSEYAVPAVQWACGAGLVEGSDGSLLPRDCAQRAQTAAILHRFCVILAST